MMKTLLITLLCLCSHALRAQSTNYGSAIILSQGLAAGSIQATSNAVVGGLVVNTNATVGGTLGVTGIITGVGSGITALNAANISSGTVPTARLGSGSATSSTYLRGDQTWATVSGGSGTVTSIAITAPPWLTVTGSPQTTAGTIDLAANGSTVTHNSLSVTNNGAFGSANVTNAFSVKSLVITNTITSYNGDTTAGNGLGSIVGSVTLTGQTSGSGPTTILTAPSGGALYALSFYAECTTISGTGAPTLAVTFNWTDDNAAQANSPVNGMSLSAKGYNNGNATSPACKTVWVASGQTLTYTTVITSAAGTPQFAVRIAVMRLQ